MQSIMARVNQRLIVEKGTVQRSEVFDKGRLSQGSVCCWPEALSGLSGV